MRDPQSPERAAGQRNNQENSEGRHLALQDEISLVDIGTTLLRHIKLMVWVPLLLAFLIGLATILSDRKYEAHSSFLPQVTSGALSRYAGLASQLGLSGAGVAQAGETVEFYADLLNSRNLLEKTVQVPYSVAVDETLVTADLLQLWEIEGDTERNRLQETVAELRRRISVDRNLNTGVVQVKVQAESPELAEQITRTLIDLLSEYNLERRQSQAAAERVFAEARSAEVRQELLEVEQQLQRFLEENRTYQSSPQLVFQAARLQRRLDVQQQLYLSLVQNVEQARLEEVRNTPVITVVDPPEGSAEPLGRSAGLKVLLALAVGLIIAVGVALLLEQTRQRREENPDEFAEFDSLRRSAFSRIIPRRTRTSV